jgi:predicted Zn-dependent protease
MRRRSLVTISLLGPVLSFSILVAIGQTPGPEWQPPTPRKDHTLFAPKPHQGNNIFTGEAEIWLSDAIEEGVAFGELNDPAITDYVAKVGTNLGRYCPKPKRRFTFVVTDDDRPDAMTSGAGRIYVSVGLLKLVQNEDELAGIIAHEISHDVFGHIPKTFTRQLFWMTKTKKVTSPVELRNKLEQLFHEYQNKPVASLGETLLGIQRFDELEADRGAFYMTYRAGYNPTAMTKALERYAEEQKKDTSKLDYGWSQIYAVFLGDHPPTAQRSLAFVWESNFVNMPPEKSLFKSPAFDEMKRRLEAFQDFK